MLKIILPNTVPENPEPILNVMIEAPEMFNVEPAAIDKWGAATVPLPMLSVTVPVELNTGELLPIKLSFPMDSDETFVTVGAAMMLPSKTRISSGAGVERAGFQLPGVAQLPLATFQVNVDCE